MSVTFFLRSGETFYPACPDCGGRINWDPQPDRSCQHPDCGGYGPDPVESTPSLNIANANARILLVDVLGFETCEVSALCGELIPEDLRQRLAMAGYRAAGAVRPTVVDGNFIHCGLGVDQITRYCEVLDRMAALASRRDEPILFG